MIRVKQATKISHIEQGQLTEARTWGDNVGTPRIPCQALGSNVKSSAAQLAGLQAGRQHLAWLARCWLKLSSVGHVSSA